MVSFAKLSAMNYLFDLDGLLINSEELYFEANKIYFSQFDFDFTEAIHKEGTGKKFAEWIKTVIDLDIDGQTLLGERNKIFYKLAKSRLHLLTGAKDVLRYTKSQGKVALVTSSNKDYVEFVFNHTGIADYFDIVITGDQVTKGKPNPEGYLAAASQLGVSPATCVVFEDAPNGVVAGKNARMKVVAVPSPFVKGDHIFDTADLELETLEDFEANEDKLISKSIV